jgi:hypothetical protein
MWLPFGITALAFGDVFLLLDEELQEANNPTPNIIKTTQIIGDIIFSFLECILML